jgi:hypothetical protein
MVMAQFSPEKMVLLFPNEKIRHIDDVVKS